MIRIKKEVKKSLSILLVLLLVFGNTSLANQTGAESLNPGEVSVDKHRSQYELRPGDTTDISLVVQAEGTTIPAVVDLVIVIDISNSMVNNTDTNGKTVMELTQEAAISLANQILGGSSASRIALVRYGDFASVYDFTHGSWISLSDSTSNATLVGDDLYTSNLNAVTTRINNIRNNMVSGYERSGSWNYIKDQGGTTTEAGLILTNLVAGEATHTSYAVFMSDGVPTSRMIGQNGEANGLYGITRDGSGTLTSDAEKNESIAAAQSLAAKPNTTSFSVAVTLGLSSSQKTVSNAVMSQVASDPGKYYKTNTPATDINNIYLSIGQTIVDCVAKNAKVIDIVPSCFEVSNLPANITAEPQADGSTKLTWDIGDLMKGTISNQYTLTLKEGHYGIIDTNVSAVLQYDNHCMGTGDPNTEADRTFPIPEIKAQPKAKDDDYTTPDNVNPYTIPVSILKNDVNEKKDSS